MPPSWWMRVIQPVLCATRVPADSPAGIISLNSCAARMSIIASQPARVTSSQRAIASSTRPNAAAVVVLFIPRA